MFVVGQSKGERGRKDEVPLSQLMLMGEAQTSVSLMR
jgi:hypothetical protein